jgi:uracil-DNA glycosylase family 4
MDGKEQLRRYLQQRKEAGERDLVLDQLNVEDVLKLVGAQKGGAGTAKREAKPPIADVEVRPTTPVSERQSNDWREVLRQSGASPEAEGGRPPPSASSLQPPAGLSVGDDDRQLFGGPLASLETLDAVASAIASCTRCPLYSTAKNPVPGQGNPNAELMIVGEAPGATEDEQGLAFVGAAGQLLTKILGAVDLKRDDVFICNVLKHRPPGNRNPMPDEVTACTPFLVRQFELIRPRAILALGTFAAQTLLQTKLAIGKLRSQVHRYHGVPLIVTYHPAALLRNPAWKRPTWEDVQLVRRILDSTVAQP